MNIFACEALANNHCGLMMVQGAISHSLKHGKHGLETPFIKTIILCNHFEEIGVVPFKLGKLLFDLIGCAS